MKPPFINRVKATLETHKMLTPGDRIIVGLSGGPDSIALVRVLLALKDELGFTLGCAHLNHNLRGAESQRDEEFVKTFTATHGLDLTLESRDINSLAKEEKLSLEEAGRNSRYDFFNRTADACGYTRIATGHNWDDHVEWVVMNLIRGTGPGGLRGIAPVRENRLIRPLIQMPKADILEFLESKNQTFVMDSSNSDPIFFRNRVRNRLIPFLEKEFNPDIRTGLDRLSHILALEDDYMAAQAEDAFDSVFIRENPKGITLSLPGLSALHPALAARVLRRGLLRVKQDLKRITQTHIRDILNLARHPENSGKSLDLPGQIRVYIKEGEFSIRKESSPLRELGRRQKDHRLKSRANKDMKT